MTFGFRGAQMVITWPSISFWFSAILAPGNVGPTFSLTMKELQSQMAPTKQSHNCSGWFNRISNWLISGHSLPSVETQNNHSKRAEMASHLTTLYQNTAGFMALSARVGCPCKWPPVGFYLPPRWNLGISTISSNIFTETRKEGRKGQHRATACLPWYWRNLPSIF